MRVQASAPAKLVILGEYAVLDGATALVAAVNRRVTVDVDPFGMNPTDLDASDSESWHFRSDLLGGRRADVHWSGENAAAAVRAEEDTWLLPALAVTREVLATAGVQADQMPACDVHIRSSDLYLEQGRTKLGLGSSAAVVVALAEALRYGLRIWGLDKSEPSEVDAFREDLTIHHELQGGRGSGIDVAASFHGGLRTFDREAGAGAPLDLPSGMAFGVVWTGKPASTASFVELVEATRLARPAEHRASIQLLTETAAAGIEACREDRGAAFLQAVRQYHMAMAALGTLCGLQIVSAPHQEIAAIAQAEGHAYKPSGAGGGDVGLLFAPSAEALAQTASLVEAAGYRLLDLAIDPAGVSVSRHERQRE